MSVNNPERLPENSKENLLVSTTVIGKEGCTLKIYSENGSCPFLANLHGTNLFFAVYQFDNGVEQREFEFQLAEPGWL